jgi:hypothetical protein
MEESITTIEELDYDIEMIDIEVNGNHLFFANNILTHNSNSDVELTDTSESFGLPATADLMIAFISTEQLEKMNQIMVKQLKNRYNDANVNKRFTVGIDRSKMRLYDISDPTANIMGSDPVAPQVAATPFSRGKDKKSFNDFKV